MSAGTATVRYFGGAKTAAGMRSELVAVRADATVEGLVAALAASHGEALGRVLAAAASCSTRSPCTTDRSWFLTAR
jgi:hypothetical protein